MSSPSPRNTPTPERTTAATRVANDTGVRRSARRNPPLAGMGSFRVTGLNPVQPGVGPAGPQGITRRRQQNVPARPARRLTRQPRFEAALNLTEDNVRAVMSSAAGRNVYVVLVRDTRNPGGQAIEFALRMEGERIEERRMHWRVLGGGNYYAVAVPSRNNPEVPALYNVHELQQLQQLD